MGYRLEISEIKHKACGNKLYGYYNAGKMKSYKYLLEKGYLDGSECFDYGFYGNIILNAREFREFIKLYNEDYNKFKEVKLNLLEDKNIKELLNSDDDKLIQWS